MFKAIGVPTRSILAGLALQAVIVALLAAVLGIGALAGGGGGGTPSVPAGTCVANGSCSGGIATECGKASDCGSGQLCCFGAPAGDAAAARAATTPAC